MIRIGNVYIDPAAVTGATFIGRWAEVSVVGRSEPIIFVSDEVSDLRIELDRRVTKVIEARA